MRGTLVQRYKGSWSIVLDVGYQVDSETGKRKRQQKWITVRGPRRDAEAKLSQLVHDAHRGEFVQPHRRTFGEWLDEWVDKAIKPPAKTQRAYESYRATIDRHLKPALGAILLQQLKASDLKRYYTDAQRINRETGERDSALPALSPSTVALHHALIHSALQAAVLDGLVTRNVAKLVVGKPHAPHDRPDAREHCWEAHEAKTFLATAKAAGPQPAAFYVLALDTGLRKAELAGLKWSDLDLAAGRVKIERQLVKRGGPALVFGPVKNKTPRTIEIAAETVALLRQHRGHQAEIKLRNGAAYTDHGIVFAKEPGDRRRGDTLGDPLQVNNLGQREFARLIKAAGVRRIKFHGLRHTCATLLLSAGVPPNVVQKRLGHKKIEMTLGIYAHALPAMQQDAAERLAALLH